MFGSHHLAQYAPFAPLQVTYRNPDGTPINLRHGGLLTEDRGVFIQNLSYDATVVDVENLMRDAGRIVRCEINTHTDTGRSKGSAIVTFTSAEDVMKAREMFDGTLFMGRPLTVRSDKVTYPLINQDPTYDTEASIGESSGEHQQEPIIVDGSIGSA